ncbi:MAG: Single-stranded DNA-binding protein [Mycobacterium sp.]|nr:Single-stranded DNA-binding protein [Mycobacterium sp.]
MFETPLTVTGRIVTAPVRRRVGDQELVKFRLASNSRRRTGDGTWEPGNSLYLTVNCWGKLATGVSGSLAKGDAVIVVGYVYTSEYEDREGVKRSSAELRATAVGPDLSWYLVEVKKINPNGQPAAVEAETAVEAGTAVEAETADEARLDEALALSA